MFIEEFLFGSSPNNRFGADLVSINKKHAAELKTQVVMGEKELYDGLTQKIFAEARLTVGEIDMDSAKILIEAIKTADKEEYEGLKKSMVDLIFKELTSKISSLVYMHIETRNKSDFLAGMPTEVKRRLFKDPRFRDEEERKAAIGYAKTLKYESTSEFMVTTMILFYSLVLNSMMEKIRKFCFYKKWCF